MNHENEEKSVFSFQEGMEMVMGEKPIPKTVCVLDKDGQTIAPCTPKRARILLERGVAEVIQFVPFTIKLQKETGESVRGDDFALLRGTTNVCISNIGQSRTVFMLQQAIRFTKENRKVLFLSTMTYQHVLDTIMKQHVDKHEYDVLGSLHIEVAPNLTEIKTQAPSITKTFRRGQVFFFYEIGSS